MSELEGYCSDICLIDGLITYIIAPAHCDALAADRELLEQLEIPGGRVSQYIRVVRANRSYPLHVALVRHEERLERFQWELVHCYKNGGAFCHVFYRDSWMCMACRHVLSAPIIMPMSEADGIFYCGTKNRFPAIPPLFQKLRCPACGGFLQNHLMILEANSNDTE